MSTIPTASLSGPALSGATLPDWLRLTTRYVQELEYGQVTLTIHQSTVIEVQKTERTRLPQPKRG